MAYEKINWTTSTPLSIQNLNKMENGIEENANTIENLSNEIKTIFVDNTEVETNEYLNGKKVYKKRLSFTTTLELNTVLSVPVEIENVEFIWLDNCYMYNNNTSDINERMSYPIPFNAAPNEPSTYIGIRINGTNIELLSNGGWSTLWTKVITVKYTKGE